MIKLIARMTADWALAEDLAQEAFVKAFRNLAAFDTTRRLSSWLFRIAHNTALDALRRSSVRVVPIDATGGHAEDAWDPPEASAAPDPVEREALGEALTTALKHLRPQYRVAIMLRYEEGLPFDQVGQILGVPEATARSHVHRARKELARHLADAGWSPSR